MELHKGNNWDVIFCDWCQDFVGQCIISSTKQSLSDLTNEEWIELGKIEKELERVCKKVFNATMFNFTCLMNNAFREDEILHVHFWFFPRYKEPLNLFNKTFVDKHFGYNFWKWSLDRKKTQKDIFTQEERLKFYDMLKREFKVQK